VIASAHSEAPMSKKVKYDEQNEEVIVTPNNLLQGPVEFPMLQGFEQYV
jgi:hypothetical protein